jgi:sec-independent protein translocase protein TatA
MVSNTVLFLPVGGVELLILLVAVVFLFGAKKIPKLARSSGEAIGEFQKGQKEMEKELEEFEKRTEQADSPDRNAAANEHSD